MIDPRGSPPRQQNEKGMDSIIEAMVHEVGLQYVQFGHSELLGRVVGLLIATPRPLSEEEIATELNVSKSPINQITRRLEDLKQVRRVRFKGDRKYYYEIAPDVFFRAAERMARLYEDNLRIADTHLREALLEFREASPESRAAVRTVCERLLEMREFHARQIGAYRQFLEEWQRIRPSLPSVEEYLEQMEADSLLPIPA
jgi:HTH-type transcriptional regulator, osmoprotectant uptake regulator